MKFIFAPMLVFLLLSCGTPTQKSNTVVIIGDTTTVTKDPPKVIIAEPIVPKDAVTANYRAGIPAFYGYVNTVNAVQAKTTILLKTTGLLP